MVADVDGHDVPVLWLRVCHVAFLAPPLARIDLDDLFVAAFGQAGRVGDAILLDVDDRRLESEVVGVLRHAEILLPDL